MGWGNEKEDDGSSWTFSTEPSSSDANNADSATGVSPFSTDPAQNIGERPLSNWGEEPRLDDTPGTRMRSIWHSISRLFGAPRN